jgi:hypothetical protein
VELIYYSVRHDDRGRRVLEERRSAVPAAFQPTFDLLGLDISPEAASRLAASLLTAGAESELHRRDFAGGSIPCP